MKNKKNFLSQYPKLMKEWDWEKNKDLDVKKITHGSHRKVGWICSKCIYKWEAKIKNRTMLKSICPICARQAIGTNKKPCHCL